MKPNRTRSAFACLVFVLIQGGAAPLVSPAVLPLGETTETLASAAPFVPKLRAVDGGSNYFTRFKESLPSDATFFPVGVWLESVMDLSDVQKDQANGINTYVDLTANSNPDQLKGTDAHFLTTWDYPGRAGAVLSDEVDMWGGPGDAKWTGERPGGGAICEPATKPCGYTIMRKLSDPGLFNGVLRYANYGKGVTFWELDSEAARFANDFQDVVSADNYWFTDPNICGFSEGGTLLPEPRELSESECRRAANYGWTVDRLRGLITPLGSKPVWAFVEVGHPATENYAPTITGPQARAAVWSSIIHGARGIVYFNHSFGGCYSQHVLRDPCGDGVRPWIAETNSQIRALAPVLNAPFVENAVIADGHADVAVKTYNGDLYIIAGSTTEQQQQVSFTLSCGQASAVRVLGENRSLTLAGARYEDNYDDGNSVHIYHHDVGDSFGLKQ
jgi:hypothetical protein